MLANFDMQIRYWIIVLKGVHSKQETDVDFEDKIQDCLAVLTKQKEVYNAENRALRVSI
jgi:hypothetical protein